MRREWGKGEKGKGIGEGSVEGHSKGIGRKC